LILSGIERPKMLNAIAIENDFTMDALLRVARMLINNGQADLANSILNFYLE
jgi:hypothetical protein